MGHVKKENGQQVQSTDLSAQLSSVGFIAVVLGVPEKKEKNQTKPTKQQKTQTNLN